MTYCEPTWVETTREHFFSTVGQLNVHPRPTGKPPYLSLWETPNREVLGKSRGGRYWVREKGEVTG